MLPALQVNKTFFFSCYKTCVHFSFSFFFNFLKILTTKDFISWLYPIIFLFKFLNSNKSCPLLSTSFNLYTRFYDSRHQSSQICYFLQEMAGSKSLAHYSSTESSFLKIYVKILLASLALHSFALLGNNFICFWPVLGKFYLEL